MKKEVKKVEPFIDVDPNFKPSEDAMFGHELSKNPVKWYQYFGVELPKNYVHKKEVKEQPMTKADREDLLADSIFDFFN